MIEQFLFRDGHSVSDREFYVSRRRCLLQSNSVHSLQQDQVGGDLHNRKQEERALVSVDSCSSAPRLPHLLDISGGEAHNDQPAVPSNTFERWNEEADRVVDDVNAIAVRQF